MGECWHEGSSLLNVGYHCRKCDKAFSVNRTFDNRNDLLDLYEAIYMDGKWIEFEAEIYERVFIPYYYKEAKAINNFNAWLFCLSGDGYEERCKIVSEFYGWEENNG
ncbi:MAG: hypothetical protein BWY21_01112 [Parcubacteria group bacterium ADurb.Bin216]|nr:MAG: hypothetical protein BWY21_01112 [Parcubacteria group bacterium ADurb.Bin216]